jgi:hypothetical protein
MIPHRTSVGPKAHSSKAPGYKARAVALVGGAWLTLAVGSVWMLAIPALATSTLATAAVEADTPERVRPAIVVEQGSYARQQVVAIGRDLEVRGEAESDVAAIGGSIRVFGRVKGDVVAMGGDCELLAGAQIGGDVFVLGGNLIIEEGVEIGGRSVSYPTVSSAWLTLMEGPSLGLASSSRVVIGAKLALLAAWLALTLVLLATSGRQILSTSDQIRIEPARDFVVGVTGVLALFMTALLFSAFAAAVVGLPLLILVLLLLLMLKLWGMVAVFHVVGAWVTSRVLKRRVQPLNSALVGLLILGCLKLIPWVGIWIWTIASLVGVGASLVTKFGRQEPWFDFDLDLDPSQVIS